MRKQTTILPLLAILFCLPAAYAASILSPQSSVLSPQSSVLSPQSSVLSPQSSVLSPQSSVLSPQQNPPQPCAVHERPPKASPSSSHDPSRPKANPPYLARPTARARGKKQRKPKKPQSSRSTVFTWIGVADSQPAATSSERTIATHRRFGPTTRSGPTQRRTFSVPARSQWPAPKAQLPRSISRKAPTFWLRPVG